MKKDSVANIMRRRIILGIIGISTVIMATNFVPAFSDNNDVKILLNNGVSAINNDDIEAAIPYFDQVLKIEPNNTAALVDKGVALGSLQKYDEAITYFDRVLVINPNDINALNNKAAALVKLHKFNEATVLVDQVLKMQPTNLVALSNKRVAINHGDYSYRSGLSDFFNIFCQIEILDSHGTLVAYIEPPDIYVPDPYLLNAALDTTSPTVNFTFGAGEKTLEKSNFTKNGKEYDEFKITTSSKYDGPFTVASKTGILQGKRWLHYANHDGYQLFSGDTVIQKWIIIRLHV